MQRLKQILINLIWRYFASCREVTEMASQLLDEEELPWRKRLSMRVHILTCRGCQNYLSHLKFMREVFQKTEDKNLEITLSPEAKERMKKAVKSANSGF